MSKENKNKNDTVELTPEQITELEKKETELKALEIEKDPFAEKIANLDNKIRELQNKALFKEKMNEIKQREDALKRIDKELIDKEFETNNPIQPEGEKEEEFEMEKAPSLFRGKVKDKETDK